MTSHANGNAQLEDAAQGAADMLAIKAYADAMHARSRAGDDEQDLDTYAAIQPFYPISLPTLAGMDIPPISYTVDGLFPAGALILLSGREKSGKSLLFVDIACSIAAGEHLFGRLTTPGPVIFCPAEDSIRTIRDRLDARLMGKTLTDGRPFYLLPISGAEMGGGVVEGVRLDLRDPLSIARFAQMIYALRPTAILVDTLRETHGARENEADDMAPVLRQIRNLAHETGTTIIFAHHASKAGGSRGSTAIAAGCDVIAQWTADADDEDGGEDGVMSGVLMVKGRDVPKATIKLRMTDTLRFHPVEMPVGATAPTMKGSIILALNTHGPLTGNQIAERAGLQPGSVKNTLTQMVKETKPMIEVASGTGSKTDPYLYRQIIRHSSEPTAPTASPTQSRAMTNDDEQCDPIAEANFRDTPRAPSLPRIEPRQSA